MSDIKYNCELSCATQNKPAVTDFIVLTGGPGAGKTATLEMVRKVFCEHIAILPESASILFGGGFWRSNSPAGISAAQRAIFHVQRELEQIVNDDPRWILGLCDRGTLDGLAYWPGTYKEYFRQLGISKEQELARYKAVIHLRSPTVQQGYNHQNPIRIESAKAAAAIDQKIQDVWCSHPQYFVVQSENLFIDKVCEVIELIRGLMPEDYSRHAFVERPLRPRP